MTKCTVTALAFTSLFLSSCQPDTIEIPDKELYTREFIKQFGVFDPDQSWNSASRTTAVISPTVTAKAETVEIYTAWPGNKEARMLASYPASTNTFDFDMPQNIDQVYVMVKDYDGKTIESKYLAVNDNVMTLAAEGEGDNQPQKKPLPTIYDLTQSPALGTIPITSYNEGFWKEFKSNSGSSLYKTSQSATNHPTDTDISIYKWVDESNTFTDENIIGDDGFDLGEWDNNGVAIKQGDIPNDISSGNILKLKIKFKLNGDSPEFKLGKADGNWSSFALFNLNDYCKNNDISDGSTFEYELSLQGSQIDNVKNGLTHIQGKNLIVYSVSFKEEPSAGTINISDIFNLYGLTEGMVSDIDGYKASYLKPNNTYDYNGYAAKDLVSLVGEQTGRFHESVSEKQNYQCNLQRFSNELNPVVDYTLQSDGEVSIDYFFGAASYFNSFGYFYYTDAEKDDIAVLLRKPKFILIYNAWPGNNLLFQRKDGEWISDKGLTDLIGTTETQQNDQGHSWDQECVVVTDKEDGNFESNEGKDASENWNHCMRPKRFIDDAENNHTDDDKLEPDFTGRMRSANYRLVYYPDAAITDGKVINPSAGTYIFPKGTHIAFFIIQGGQYWIHQNGEAKQKIDHRRIAFSRPHMNGKIANTIHGGHTHSEGQYGPQVNNGNGEEQDWTAFVSYLWNGSTILGVEDYTPEWDGNRDGGDHDMNDMLFRINGDLTKPDEEMNPEPTPSQSWLIACEDLGGTFDFDFNDVIFGVSHVSGKNEATVTALASGGTLPVYLWSKYPQITGSAEVTNEGNILIPDGSNQGEFHSWWGKDRPHHSIINAHSWNDGAGATVRIRVPEDFSLAEDDSHAKPDTDGELTGSMGGFKVIVHEPDNIKEITAPQKGMEFVAPQMFLVPSEWLWPRERQNILDVYSGFKDWTNGWWKNRDGVSGSNVVNHGWNKQ